MPVIPQQTIPGKRVSTPGLSRAGSPNTRALDTLFDAAGRASSRARKTIEQIDRERNIIAGQAAINTLSAEASEYQRDIRSRRGADALGATDEYHKWYTDRMQEIRGKLSNSDQRFVFQSTANPRLQQDLTSIFAFEQEQDFVNRKDVYDQTVHTATQRIVADPFNDATFAESLTNIGRTHGAAFPGRESTKAKTAAIEQLQVVRMTAMLDQDPVKTQTYMVKNKESLGNSYYAMKDKVHQEAEYLKAQKAFPDEYEKQIDYVESLQCIDGAVKKSIAARIKNDRSEEDSRERRMEERYKDWQESNDNRYWVKLHKGQLTTDDVIQGMQSTEITTKGGNAMIKQLKNPTTTNDPFTVGEIAEKMALGEDVRQELDAAVSDGSMKAETYINFRGKIGNQDFQRGLKLINSALKPSEADKYDPDRNFKHAEAIDRYRAIVSGGTDPLKASKSVLRSHRDTLARTVRGIPFPEYMTGNNKLDASALDAAERETVLAWSRGNIGYEEYQRQLGYITELRWISEGMDSTQEGLDLPDELPEEQ